MSETPPPPEGTPTRRRYSDGAAPEPPKLPFAYQAAKVSLAAPLIALALAIASLLLTTTMDADAQRTIKLGIGVLIDVLLLTGLVTGIVALLAVRRLGGKGLVVRSVIGVLVSALMLTVVGLSIYSTVYGPAQRVRALAGRIVGSWESTLPAHGKSVHVFMTLNADGTARWKLDADPVIDATAKWTIGLQKSDGRAVLVLKFEPPVEKPQHIEGVHWTIDSASDSQLSLSNAKDDGTTTTETYVRAHP